MTAPTDASSSAAQETYRALRIGLVAAGALLACAVVLHIIETRQIPGSISATYYTPVRAAFVGALLATGLALVAIKGRSAWEDGLLNVAGGVVPLVAFVPTPVRVGTIAGASDHYTCPDPAQACIPIQVRDGVANNVSAYGIVIAAILLLATIGAAQAHRRGQPWGTLTRVGLATAALLWATASAWFLLARESFQQHAHYASALVFFGLLIGVVWRGGWNLPTTAPTPGGMSALGYRRWYFALAGAMTLAVLTGVVAWFVQPTPATTLLFWLEVALLAGFMAFWVLQTMEYWHRGRPGEVVRAAPG